LQLRLWLILSCLLAGCVPVEITGTIAKQSGGTCDPDAYESLINSQSKDLAPGLHRDIVMSALSRIATEVWKRKEENPGACHFQYLVSYPYAGSTSDSPFSAEVTISYDLQSVCVGQDDFLGTTYVGLDREHAYQEFAWEYVESREVAGATIKRKRFLPICFSKIGEFVRFSR